MNNETEQLTDQKVCESCGESFGCGARLEGCWCAELKIPAETVADLRAEFRDCLCPTCLGTKAT